MVAGVKLQAWRKVMAAYRLVYDSRHLQADCQEPGSAPEPYARATSMGYLYLLQFYLSQTERCTKNINHEITIHWRHKTETAVEKRLLTKATIGLRILS